MGRLRFKPWADDYTKNSKLVINDPASNFGNWKNIFPKENPIHIEIGMGKGKFIQTLSLENENINYLGIEKYASVQVIAISKTEESKDTSNLLFLNQDATFIEDWFKKGEVEKIYINFPDPWPKERHKKRRLVSNVFYDKFYNILTIGNLIEFKTDQKKLYEFALEELSDRKEKWEIVENYSDLHKQFKEKIIMTEYETKFTNMNNPIYKITVRKI